MHNARPDPTMLRLVAALFAVLTAGSVFAQNQVAPMAAAAAGVGRVDSARDAGLTQADSIVVRKSERRLYLMRNGAVLRSFKVALGLRPEGHKEYEGDFRTPEGKYRLIRRNPNSEFFLSLQVSYPNETDIAKAKRLGMRPGGNIMIHGRPNTPRKSPDYYANVDWTEGCISVSNSDMVEIWLMTPLETPIEIQP
jgi:murein L,D-transpeptidase YafK